MKKELYLGLDVHKDSEGGGAEVRGRRGGGPRAEGWRRGEGAGGDEVGWKWARNEISWLGFGEFDRGFFGSAGAIFARQAAVLITRSKSVAVARTKLELRRQVRAQAGAWAREGEIGQSLERQRRVIIPACNAAEIVSAKGASGYLPGATRQEVRRGQDDSPRRRIIRRKRVDE